MAFLASAAAFGVLFHLADLNHPGRLIVAWAMGSVPFDASMLMFLVQWGCSWRQSADRLLWWNKACEVLSALASLLAVALCIWVYGQLHDWAPMVMGIALSALACEMVWLLREWVARRVRTAVQQASETDADVRAHRQHDSTGHPCADAHHLGDRRQRQRRDQHTRP